jgi:radical SAM superfamily enzyme YgiQ (UPF0313 family)
VELDALPFADFSDFDLASYSVRELPVSTSRGCINRCLFCSESRAWGKFRQRSAENIFTEIIQKKSIYPQITSFYFNDSLINADAKNLKRLSQLLIKNKVNIQWGGQALIHKDMTAELLRILRKSGLTHLSYGLESASRRVLQLIGKRFAPETAQKVIRQTKASGIRTDVNIVIGFPGETENDILQTAKFLKHNRRFIDEIFFHPLSITKGSYYYDKQKELNISFENAYNPNSWYIKEGNNSLPTRLKKLEFYQRCLNNGKGKSFFSLCEYYTFIAEEYEKKESHKKALEYYLYAKEKNTNFIRGKNINRKIRTLTRAMEKEERLRNDHIHNPA